MPASAKTAGPVTRSAVKASGAAGGAAESCYDTESEGESVSLTQLIGEERELRKRPAPNTSTSSAVSPDEAKSKNKKKKNKNKGNDNESK